MKETKKLEPRDWRLHDYLMSLKGEHATKKMICDNVEGFPYREKNADVCVEISLSVKRINKSYECDHMIVFEHQEFWIGTAEDVLKLAERKKEAGKRAFSEYGALMGKLAKNGQAKLLNNAGNPAVPGTFYQTVREEDGRVG